MKKILIVEDDMTLQRELAKLLADAGYEPIVLTDAGQESIREMWNRVSPDLVLLDINLPGLNGQEILRQIRKISDVPVFMLTSRTAEVDEILSMSYGADGYITKPYNPAILLLRISAMLKRAQGGSADYFWHGMQVSVAKGSICGSGQEMVLTKNEMIIFEQLLLSVGEIVTRDTLMTALWDNEEYINDNALTVNISRLRTKLSRLGVDEPIETRKKQGYVLH